MILGKKTTSFANMCTALRNTTFVLLLRSTENVFTARYRLNLKQQWSTGVLKGVVWTKDKQVKPPRENVGG